MTSMYLYVISSNGASKIGVTSDIDGRLRSYHTHNHDIALHSLVTLDESKARSLEAAVKSQFAQHKVGRGMEWFKVAPGVMQEFVVGQCKNHGGSATLKTPASRSYSALIPPRPYTDIVTEIHNAQEQLGRYSVLDQCVAANKCREKIEKLKQKAMELFAAAFDIGVPEHKLPDNLVYKEGLLCRDSSSNASVTAAWQAGLDHVESFYVVLPTDNGVAAFVSAMVSMPYPGRQVDYEVLDDLGWVLTEHNDWSWYGFGTHCHIIEHETEPAHRFYGWARSFERWVLGNQKWLDLERRYPRAMGQILAYDINPTVANCDSRQSIANRYKEQSRWWYCSDEYCALIDEWLLSTDEKES